MGWIILSALCFFAIIFVVQLFTFQWAELPMIINNLLLFLFSALVALAFKNGYGIIGAAVFSGTVLLLMYLGNNLSFELYSVCALIVLGAAVGTCIRQKKRMAWMAALLTGGLVLFNAYQKYSTIQLVKVSAVHKTDATRFNTIANKLVSMNGETLQLSQDTVYLINFTFHACKPCRDKRPSLELLETAFVHQPFKLVTIHCVESEAVFKAHYRDYANCYHNSNPKLEQQLNIPSYPYEIIFDKNGREVRRFGGFSPDAKNDYLEKTRKLIKQLVHEK